MAQLVTYLIHKHEDLSSVHSANKGKESLTVALQFCNLNAGEETEGPQDLVSKLV